MMKKRRGAIFIGAVMVLVGTLLITGCGGSGAGGDTEKGDDGVIPHKVSMKEIFVQVNDLFDYPAVAMGTPIDEQMLQDLFEISPEKTVDYAGEMSMSMTNSDVFLGVRAAKGEIESVKTAMETKLKDLQAQYEQYPVMGSKERVDTGEVYVVGDCAFLIVVGVIGDDMGDGPYDFSHDVAKVKKTIHGFAK
ncbi:MAG: DUF4358 domain-containing protein [Anaerovorax sp.]